jgi:hypothetical protein
MLIYLQIGTDTRDSRDTNPSSGQGISGGVSSTTDALAGAVNKAADKVGWIQP